jgi:hypothetical protein
VFHPEPSSGAVEQIFKVAFPRHAVIKNWPREKPLLTRGMAFREALARGGRVQVSLFFISSTLPDSVFRYST